MSSLRLGARTFVSTDFAVMAIVNRTPDSFFDKGATFGFDAAVRRIDQVVAEGADIVDIGGVKAGQGPPVEEADEIARTVDLVAEVRNRHPDLVISVDTYRSRVADALCAAGAHLVNDTWAGSDPGLAEVAARWGAGLVCSHTGGQQPRTDPHRVRYADVVADVIEGTTMLAERAVVAGVRRDGILIDPTHDFGKNTYHSLELTRRLGELVDTGWPVLVSLSRKDFVGETLGLPVDARLPGTLAATAVSAWHGARVFRAHDVAATRQVVDMVASIKGDRRPAAPQRGLA
ncbi:MAG TPA: dihydropteroate synthase [Jiangellaceae bacterium]|nr:dihydropteroate synthase [Jiangellaceae bacterium]